VKKRFTAEIFLADSDKYFTKNSDFFRQKSDRFFYHRRKKLRQHVNQSEKLRRQFHQK